MTTPPAPDRSDCTFRPDSSTYPVAEPPSPRSPGGKIPAPPPYPGRAVSSGDGHPAGGRESSSAPGVGKPSPHEVFSRRGRVHLAKRQRGIDATAVGQLLLQLPSFLASLVIVAVLSHILLPAVAWLVVLLWLASGALAFHRPTERALAHHLLNLRHPTPRERAWLEPLWREVTARTGVEGRAYELWIEDSNRLNALAAAGHIVGVTRYSLERLSAGQLAAILAHELGHHVRGHAWSSLLGQWYAVPGRLVWAAARRLTRLVVVIGRGRMGGWATGLLLMVGSIVLVIAMSYWFIALALAVAPYLLAAVARRVELRADHHAAAAGFGPMLAEVLHMMQAAEGENGRVAASALSRCSEAAAAGTGTTTRGCRPGLGGRLLSSHPDYHTRLHHLAPYLERR
ncbi:M48 family metalloprotease [Streptomyces sp. RK75]|uniref:M48 family metalloprotease n=1 Tax=Streptomyces sp. RK75 TaxID=2824895 RepID=UPI001B368438|nr:M48 family metalloprotease [Streptomyces sp. RK75]MBQ0863487.1 M48 family metalloprotease [Streptomyces sp. RK75]